MISLANISCSLRVGLAFVVVLIASQSNCHVRAGEIVELVGFMGCVRPQIALSLVLIINQFESICGGQPQMGLWSVSRGNGEQGHNDAPSIAFYSMCAVTSVDAFARSCCEQEMQQQQQQQRKTLTI